MYRLQCPDPITPWGIAAHLSWHLLATSFCLWLLLVLIPLLHACVSSMCLLLLSLLCWRHLKQSLHWHTSTCNIPADEAMFTL